MGAAQRDCLHLVGEQEKGAWSKATWDVYHLVQGSLQRMLFGLHELGADMGSGTAAMQVGGGCGARAVDRDASHLVQGSLQHMLSQFVV